MTTRKQKQKLAERTNILLTLGSYDKLPHYSVVGTPVSLYLYMQDTSGRGESTKWVSGVQAAHVLKALRAAMLKDKIAFTTLFRKLYKDLM